MIVGTAALAGCVGLLGLGEIGSNEPFRNVPDYFFEGIEFAGLSTIVVLVVSIPFVIPLVFGILTLAKPTGRAVYAARLRAAFLVPVSFLLPAAVWGLSAMFAYTKNPGFSFTYIAKPPAWIASGLFDLLSSEWWLWLGAAAMCWSAVVAAIRVGEFVPEPGEVCCERCGYSLAGLREERCPECGFSTDRPSSGEGA